MRIMLHALLGATLWIGACADMGASPTPHPATADSSGQYTGGDSYASSDPGNTPGPSYDAGAPPRSYPDGSAADASADTGSTAPDVGPAEDTSGEDVAPDVPEPPLDPPTTNPFVMVGHDPLSTFATDVDTASYDIFRQHIQAGMLPDASKVRVEEFVNAFDYDYLKPSDADGYPHPFTLDVEAAPSPFNATTIMRVGVRGRTFDAMQVPANIVWLLDVSGSMQSAAKLPLVKTFMLEALDAIPPQSTVSIVTYAGFTTVALGPTPATDKATITNTLNSLSAGGSTAGAAGIDLAYQQAELGKLAEGINVVILCSDGDFNVGVSSTQGLLDLIEDKRKTGIMLSVYGFGMSNLNDTMFEAVSNAGNGTYAVISSEEQATEYAHNNLIQNISYVAQDVKIQVAFNPDEVKAYRLLGYENRQIADVDFKNDTVDAGEIGADHMVTALYELVLTDETVPNVVGAPPVEDGAAFDPSADPSFIPAAAGSLAEVRLRYKTVGATADDPASQVDFLLTPSLLLGDSDGASADFQWATMMAGWAEVLKGSPYAPSDQLLEIQAIATANAGLAGDRQEFLTLLESALGLLGVTSPTDGN